LYFQNTFIFIDEPNFGSFQNIFSLSLSLSLSLIISLEYSWEVMLYLLFYSVWFFYLREPRPSAISHIAHRNDFFSNLLRGIKKVAFFETILIFNLTPYQKVLYVYFYEIFFLITEKKNFFLTHNNLCYLSIFIIYYISCYNFFVILTIQNKVNYKNYNNYNYFNLIK